MVNKLETDSEVDVGALFLLLKANIWIIVFFVFISLGIGAVYVRGLIPEYQSDVLLQVDVKEPGGSKNGISAMFASGYTGDSVEMQMALIKSRFILDRVVQKLGLDIKVSKPKVSFFSHLFSKSVSNDPKIDIHVFEVPRSLLNKPFRLKFDTTTTVSLFSQDGKRIIHGTIGRLLSNEKGSIRLLISKAPTHPVSDVYLTKNSNMVVVQDLIGRLKIEEVHAGHSRVATGILDMSLIGQDPTKIVKTLNTIALVAQDEDAKKKAREASKTLKFLQQQLPITNESLKKAEYALNEYRAKSGKIDVKLQTQFLLNQLLQQDKKLEELRIEKMSMTQYYTPNHPSYIALDRQIEQLKKQRIKQESIIKTLPLSEQQDVNLLRDVKVKQTLYLVLLNKIQELKVVKAGTISSVRILSKSKLPDLPLPTKRRTIYAGSVLVGIILSLIVIFSRRIWSSRVGDPQWAERHCGIPTLAIIPFSKEQKIASPGQGKDINLLSHRNPKNLTVEALRSLRTSLQVSMAGASNNIISILGAAPGVGKSFVSVNIAYLLAVSGKKVIVVDGDLRRGTIHRYLGIPSSPGLSDVLKNNVSLDEAIQSTTHLNLDCLPRGTHPQDPSELLMNASFKTVINTISERYDLVIIDTSPILLVTDGVIVGGLAGTNYIVFGADAHQPADIEMAIRRLTGAGVHVNGSIFNFHKEKNKLSANYYEYYYNSYTYYYHNTEEV